MKAVQTAICVIGIAFPALTWVDPAAAQRPCDSPAPVVGRVIIIGNTITRDDIIRKALCLYPAQEFQPADLREAEQRLARLGIFETDPKKGGPPTVTAIPLPDEPTVLDVLVRVKETVTGKCQFGVEFNTKGRVVIRLRLEERNFDPWRLPTCFEDFEEGRVFRGGGRRFAIHLTLGSR